LQILGDLVAVEVSDNEEARSNHDRPDLVHRIDDDHTLGDLLRPGGRLHRRPRRRAVHRGVAGLDERRPLLPDRQPDLLLHPADDPDHDVLRPDLDQGVATKHPHRHQGRPDGAHAAEIEGESGEDAGGGGDPVRGVLATPVRDLRPHQARRRGGGLGGGGAVDRRPHSAVAGGVQLVHQPGAVRLLQQEVQEGVRRHHQEQEVLRQVEVLRDGGDDVVVDEHEEVVALLQQQLVDEEGAPPGRRRLLHLQQYGCLSPGNGRHPVVLVKKS
jgi:hypothetical protein